MTTADELRACADAAGKDTYCRVPARLLLAAGLALPGHQTAQDLARQNAKSGPLTANQIPVAFAREIADALDAAAAAAAPTPTPPTPNPPAPDAPAQPG
jgi:hypothetical protein